MGKIVNKTNRLFKFLLKYKKIIILIIIFFYLLHSQRLKIFKSHKKKIYKPISIPVAFAIDNKFTYPLIVLLTSILYNSSPNTFYFFYIMVTNDFYKGNEIKIYNLINKYPNCKITFYNMTDKYSNWTINNYYSISVYYRLSLSDLIRDFEKLIYLDCDTIVHEDLSELYNIEMGNNFYMGFPSLEISYMVINETRNFINSGVILINLKLLRKINASSIFKNFYKNYGTQKVDEYLINVIFYNHISFLPLKFGIPDFSKDIIYFNSPKQYWNIIKKFINGTRKNMILSSLHPSITHGAFTLKKWWNRNYNELTKIGKKWIFYASKTHVFKEICEIYIQFKELCK